MARYPSTGTARVLYACTATEGAAPAVLNSRAFCRNLRVAFVHSLTAAVGPSHVSRHSAAEPMSIRDHWGMASVSHSFSRVTWLVEMGVRSTMWHVGMPRWTL